MNKPDLERAFELSHVLLDAVKEKHPEFDQGDENAINLAVAFMLAGAGIIAVLNAEPAND